MKQGFVYIMASKRNDTLDVGVTSDLIKMVYEHKNNIIRGFTSKYNVHFLVYFKAFNDIKQAINREKQIKGWSRKKKLDLIEFVNAQWKDLSEEWILDSSLRWE